MTCPDDRPVGPGGTSGLLERLAAVEAGIHADRHRLPAAVVGEIARLRASGATVAAISAETGVSKDIVRDRLRRAGALGHLWSEQHRHVQDVFERRGAELVAAYRAGATITALAAEAGVCTTTFSTFLVARGVRLRNDRGWYRRSRPPGG